MSRKAEHSLLSEETKAIKRANFKIKYVANKYGIDSQVYKDMVAMWTNETFAPYTNIGADGIIQISTKFPKLYNAKDKNLIMSRIQRTRGIKEIESSYREFAKISRDEWKQYSTQEKTRMIKEKSVLFKRLDDMANDFYKLYQKDGTKTEFPELYDTKGEWDAKTLKEVIEKGEKILKDKDKLKEDLLNEYDERTGYKNPLKRR